MVYWFFGFPGVGKSYCATKLAAALGAPFVDADDFLTDEYRQALRDGTLTSEDRLGKLRRIAVHVNGLLTEAHDVTVADSLPNNAARQLVLDSFPTGVRLVLVTSTEATHHDRIEHRRDHFFSADMLEDWVAQHWEPITQPHLVVVNEASKQDELDQALLALTTAEIQAT